MGKSGVAAGAPWRPCWFPLQHNHFKLFCTRVITMTVLHLGSLENNNPSSSEYEIGSRVIVAVRDDFSHAKSIMAPFALKV